MRQKYCITKDVGRKTLSIREYAVVDKDLKKVPSSMLRKDNFSFLCEETYASEAIIKSIAQGAAVLIATLRTRNIFPISPYAGKIAESVIRLYQSAEDGFAELLFDDVDMVSNAHAEDKAEK